MKGHFNMIQVYNNKSECCGCGICETVCTQNAIEMKMDEIGVIYQCGQPSVNLRQVPGQSNGQWCEIGKRGK